ncbi:hypothetical protein [Rhodococcus sp. PD04]|uniref:hypothetical protein n=1 Tax=Rhodococcus sp. PD04 TaxID=3109594 RepID=UPI002DDAE628|nr:hypothetical protein [Rhodococcus sp. PD04]WSE21888.1 hypothetical protein U9J23_19825 [Rhodococcus sp. PD04]
MHLEDVKIKSAYWWTLAVLFAITIVVMGGIFKYTQDHGTYYERHPEKRIEMLHGAESPA